MCVCVCLSVWCVSLIINIHKEKLRGTGLRRPIECLMLQVSFRKGATNYRALLRKMTSKDKASYGSLPPCRSTCSWSGRSFLDGWSRGAESVSMWVCGVCLCLCGCVCVGVCVSRFIFAQLSWLITGWRKPIGCLNFTGHFLQKSPVIGGSFAESDLQVTASYGSSPPCTEWRRPIGCLIFIHLFAQKSPIISG